MYFDGSKTTPYVEGDEPNPLNVYGKTTKAEVTTTTTEARRRRLLLMQNLIQYEVVCLE
ncbi:MAG: sugar nucleotide-binding protein [Crinalium sp.]